MALVSTDAGDDDVKIVTVAAAGGDVTGEPSASAGLGSEVSTAAMVAQDLRLSICWLKLSYREAVACQNCTWTRMTAQSER